MSYSEKIRRDFKLPNGTEFRIRKMNPLRLKAFEKARNEQGALDATTAEEFINETVLAGVVEPELEQKDLDLYIKGEEEPLTYDDKNTLAIAIQMHSGVSEEALEERRKFCRQQLSKCSA